MSRKCVSSEIHTLSAIQESNTECKFMKLLYQSQLHQSLDHTAMRCVFPCVYIKESERESPYGGQPSFLLKYCQYDTNAAFYTLPLVILTYMCSPRFLLSVHLSLTLPLFFRVIKRCAHHAWLQSTCLQFLMVCGTLRACGRRATFSVPPSAHPPATRSAAYSHRTPIARRPLFPVFLSTLAL